MNVSIGLETAVAGRICAQFSSVADRFRGPLKPNSLSPRSARKATTLLQPVVMSALRPTSERGMLHVKPYSPPPWSTSLSPIPQKEFVLGQFPTPMHRWPIPDLPDGCELWLKRDDLTGLQLSGNKVRKLEFLIADAKEKGCDSVITIGGIQSNHCRATAVAARYAGLDTYLILRTSKELVEEDPGLVGNLLVERLVGCHIELVTKQEYVALGSEALGHNLLERLRLQGRKPYLIPVGGSNALGTWGYLQGVEEISQQLNASHGPGHLDDVVVACGSGGTTAGIALGVHLSGIKARVHAYGVCDSPEYFYNHMNGILRGLGSDLDSRTLVECKQAKGRGYAENTEEELKVMQETALHTGVVLDPVYSGKALHGLLKDMKTQPRMWEGRKVLFVHTGGLLGMYDKTCQLQPLVEGLSRVSRFPYQDMLAKDNAPGV